MHVCSEQPVLGDHACMCILEYSFIKSHVLQNQLLQNQLTGAILYMAVSWLPTIEENLERK